MAGFIGSVAATKRSGVRMASTLEGRRILQTNDDGFSSHGLQMLNDALKAVGAEPTVVAPAKNESACGMRLTLSHRLHLTEHSTIGERVYSLTGSPADCAILALDPGGIMHSPPPSVVVSGINLGANMSHDVLYSGTFAAARQAAMLGYPAIATSLTGYDFSKKAMESAVGATTKILELLAHILPERPINPSRPVLTRQPHNSYQSPEDCADIDDAIAKAFLHGDLVVNVNTPDDWNGTFKSTTLACMMYRDAVQRIDNEMWLGDGGSIEVMANSSPDSDVLATRSGACSITLLQTWPETHPFRVPDFLLRAAQRQRIDGIPHWMEKAALSAGSVGGN